MHVFSEDYINEVKLRNDIVSVVSEYVSLKRSGSNYVGLCPFHSEKTGSFIVSPSKQICKCFGCGEGGDPIGFLMKIENITYPEAIEILAKKANMPIPTTTTSYDNKLIKLKEDLYKINEFVANYYHSKLYLESSKSAQDYVKKRKFNNKTLIEFTIGYSGTENNLYTILKEKGFDENTILESKLVIKSKNGQYYDFFKDRLIFPIRDIKGRVIAFGGRILHNNITQYEPKYKNSPETKVYSKSRNLYGLYNAKKNKLNKILIVEGYMDVVSLHQRGITNVVASLGTALTEAQGRLLKRFSDKIVMGYDADGAGQNAIIRGMEILQSLGCDIRILQITGAKDPDEFVVKYGKDKLNLLVEKSISLVEYKVKILTKTLDLNSSNDKIKFLREIANVISKLDNEIEQEVYIDKISKTYNI